MLHQWIEFVPKYAGLSDKFKTDFAEVHVHASRDMGPDMLDADFKSMITSSYLKGTSSSFQSYRNEFFDTLTAYGNVILSGAGKDDFTAYTASKASFANLGAAQKVLEQA